jgi:hypothetical protein
VSAPYEPGRGPVAVPALRPWQQPDGSAPPGPFLPVRNPFVRVRFSDGSWRPAEALRWYKGRSIMTDAVRWYVQLRLLIDGRGEVSIGWYLFDPQHVEPR